MQFRARTEASITGSLDLWIRWIYYIHDGTMERQGHFGCSREVRFRSWVRCLGWKIRGWTKNDRRCQWVVLHSLTTHINNCHGQTLFNIASCSKAFLSASMGILIDDYANGRNNSPLPEEIKTFRRRKSNICCWTTGNSKTFGQVRKRTCKTFFLMLPECPGTYSVNSAWIDVVNIV